MNIERPKPKYEIPENAKKVFTGIIFDVYQWEQELYDGSTTIFEKIKRPDTVVIYPVLPDGKIMLIEEEQPGRIPHIGIPGGRVDEGEDILLAAKRELHEETGYEAEEYILWDAQQPELRLEWAVYTFIAKGLKKTSEPHTDAGEKIKIMPVNFDELIEITTTGNFSEREATFKFLEAKYDKVKREELKELFKPI